MREQIANFLNQHPSVMGMVLALLGCWNLWQSLIRYERYKKSVERTLSKRPWLALIGLSSLQPRPILIAASILGLIAGLTMIDFEIGLLDRKFWAAPLIISLLYLFVVFVRVMAVSKKIASKDVFNPHKKRRYH
ncbi:MAG: hypothetical protein J2P21_32645 [Chloracidobacterium sp.]|nr:hypothetical protein [Chloracidobacterium sp.]